VAWNQLTPVGFVWGRKDTAGTVEPALRPGWRPRGVGGASRSEDFRVWRATSGLMITAY